MRVFGRRFIHSQQQLDEPRLLHQTQRHTLGRTVNFHAVSYPPMPALPGHRNEPTPRVRLIITSEKSHPKHLYPSIEIHFSAEEARLLEIKLAQALGTRPVRSDARPLTRLTRQQARKRLI